MSTESTPKRQCQKKKKKKKQKAKPGLTVKRLAETQHKKTTKKKKGGYSYREKKNEKEITLINRRQRQNDPKPQATAQTD